MGAHNVSLTCSARHDQATHRRLPGARVIDPGVYPARHLSQDSRVAMSPTPSAGSLEPLVYRLRPARITYVSTPEELLAAVANNSLDIEIRAHMDLSNVLEGGRSQSPPAEVGASFFSEREPRPDTHDLLRLSRHTRSIRVKFLCCRLCPYRLQ